MSLIMVSTWVLVSGTPLFETSTSFFGNKPTSSSNIRKSKSNPGTAPKFKSLAKSTYTSKTRSSSKNNRCRRLSIGNIDAISNATETGNLHSHGRYYRTLSESHELRTIPSRSYGGEGSAPESSDRIRVTQEYDIKNSAATIIEMQLEGKRQVVPDGIFVSSV